MAIYWVERSYLCEEVITVWCNQSQEVTVGISAQKLDVWEVDTCQQRKSEALRDNTIQATVKH